MHDYYINVPEIRDEARTGESVDGAGGVGGGERPDSAERKAGEEADGDLQIPRNQRLEVRPGANVIKLFTVVIYCHSIHGNTIILCYKMILLW
jgi:hypothetical protein